MDWFKKIWSFSFWLMAELANKYYSMFLFILKGILSELFDICQSLMNKASHESNPLTPLPRLYIEKLSEENIKKLEKTIQGINILKIKEDYRKTINSYLKKFIANLPLLEKNITTLNEYFELIDSTVTQSTQECYLKLPKLTFPEIVFSSNNINVINSNSNFNLYNNKNDNYNNDINNNIPTHWSNNVNMNNNNNKNRNDNSKINSNSINNEGNHYQKMLNHDVTSRSPKNECKLSEINRKTSLIFQFEDIFNLK